MKKQKLPLAEVYARLRKAWDPLDWWPAESRLEIIVGAVLTQNTAWKNVEKALSQMKELGVLNWDRLHDATEEELAGWIRPAGTYAVKARRLKALFHFIEEAYGGSLDRMKEAPAAGLREQLLQVHGVGPETADCILLYAFDKPVFVVDAYTRRFMERHNWTHRQASYEELAELFRNHLPENASLYNEFHALIVELGKRHCRTTAQCRECPLEPLLP